MSRDALEASQGIGASMASAKVLAAYGAPAKTEAHVLVAANEPKRPSNGGPADSPDVKLRLMDPIRPAQMPEIEVKQIGTLGPAAFVGAAVITAKSVSEVQSAAKPPAQVTVNRQVGNAFRDEIASVLKQTGLGVETEVTKFTPFGRRVIDIEISHGNEVLGGVETKTGAPRYTPTQRAKDNWLRLHENYVVNVVRDK